MIESDTVALDEPNHTKIEFDPAGRAKEAIHEMCLHITAASPWVFRWIVSRMLSKTETALAPKIDAAATDLLKWLDDGKQLLKKHLSADGFTLSPETTTDHTGNEERFMHVTPYISNPLEAVRVVIDSTKDVTERLHAGFGVLDYGICLADIGHHAAPTASATPIPETEEELCAALADAVGLKAEAPGAGMIDFLSLWPIIKPLLAILIQKLLDRIG